MKNQYMCDVCIIGGGVTGTALAYTLSRFSNVRSVVLLEKYGRVATENSHPLNNAQTSHEGDTETNYTPEHALEVREAATFLRRFVDSVDDPFLSQKRLRMVIGVNKKEVAKLEKRFRDIRRHYPHLKLAYYDDVEKIEPNVTRGRDRDKPFCALVSTEGYIVNYQKLAEKFLKRAKRNNPKFRYLFNTEVLEIKREDENYLITTSSGVFLAKTVEFAAGPWSLYFAHKLGYGLKYSILQVAGSFYSAGNWLKNKVYRTQVEGRPFAEIHGDPDILNMNDTRFGPTTKPVFLMERYHPETFRPYLRMKLITTLRGISAISWILWKRRLLWYVFKNILFDLPIIGPGLFLLEAKKIVPKLRYRDLKIRKGAGGVRPQIVNLETMDLEMGDSSLVGDKIIFNTTPSPGASVCLGNARRDGKRIVEFLEPNYRFDEEKFQKELGPIPPVPAAL
ncbi:MAG: FAD-dependent oxidoreductase [Candidatus Yanofskybacteria bacterium]|nr:FAD-dependent oxidoreductase [Candidatus Yanofskybacteria bacterium]